MVPAYSLRPLDAGRDLPRLAQLIGLLWPVTLTPQRLAESEAAPRPRGEARVRTVAVDHADRVVGSAEASRTPWMATGQFFLAVVVDPADRRRGVGSRLFAEIAGYARRHGGTVGRGYVRDDRPDALRFAERHGLAVERHEFGSSLALVDFDEAPFAHALQRPQQEGFRFFSLADVGLTEPHLRQLYDLHARTAADVPGTEDAFPPFERFREQVLAPRGRSSRPDGLIVAADGERWVGLAVVSYSPEDRVAYNSHTGVLRQYRGRGLAQALKLLAIRAARSWQAERIRTDNDDQNAAMLWINRKLGYRPEPGWFSVKGPLPE